MEQITNFSQLVQRLQAHKCCNVVCVEAHDKHSQEAMKRAEADGWAKFTNIHCSTVAESATEAVRMIRCGESDVIMKGIINTDVLLKAVINKETGLLPKGNILSHVSAMKIPAYHKMLFMSDAAVIPCPTLEQRAAMIRYSIHLCHIYGIEQPRVALIHCTEKISSKFPITEDYEKLVEMCRQGQFGNAIIDGPIDLKCACCQEAAIIKGIHSPLEGNSDAVIMPDIESANVFYKAMTAFTDTQLAVGLQGAACPISITSRSDSAATKYNSLAMACLQAITQRSTF